MNSNFSLRYIPNRNTHIKTILEIYNSIIYYDYKLEATQIELEWINEKKMRYIYMHAHSGILFNL